LDSPIPKTPVYGCLDTVLTLFGLPDNRNCLLSYGNQETSENFRRCLSDPDLSGCIEDTVISPGCLGTVLTLFGLPDNRNCLLSYGNQETSENFRRCLSDPDLSGCIEDTVISPGYLGTVLTSFGLPDNRNCLLSYGNQETSENFRRCLSDPDLSGCIEDTVISPGCLGTVLTSFGLPDNRNCLLSYGNQETSENFRRCLSNPDLSGCIEDTVIPLFNFLLPKYHFSQLQHQFRFTFNQCLLLFSSPALDLFLPIRWVIFMPSKSMTKCQSDANKTDFSTMRKQAVLCSTVFFSKSCLLHACYLLVEPLKKGVFWIGGFWSQKSLPIWQSGGGRA
jgi:hypothetical protein